MKRKLLAFARTLVTRGLISVGLCGSLPATVRAASAEGALGLSVGRPLSSTLSDVYPWTLGLGLDLRVRYSQKFALSIQVAPAVGWGTPQSGALAGDPSATLWLVPGHLLVEFLPGQGKLRPYFGAGLGAVYVKEKLSFDSPLGTQEASTSTTRLSLDVLAGVEKPARTTPFAELHYQYATTSGVEEQSGSGVSLANLQLRLGVRRRFE